MYCLESVHIFWIKFSGWKRFYLILENLEVGKYKLYKSHLYNYCTLLNTKFSDAMLGDTVIVDPWDLERYFVLQYC